MGSAAVREIQPLAVYTDKDDMVSLAKAQDATKLSFPLPLMLTLIGLAITFVAGVWRVEANVSVLSNSIRYEKELDAQREKYLDQRFTALEAKIETAGLRNAALAMSQQLDQVNAKSR